jgi:hypothetical protein
MKGLGCGTVRRHLGAFCDGELPVRDRMAVVRHLEGCASCAVEARILGTIGESLRLEAADRIADVAPLDAFSAAIVGRIQAEQAVSLPARVSRMFEDMHLVWAGLSATAATVTCAALLFAIWFLSPPERADSLAGLMSSLAQPAAGQATTLDRTARWPRGGRGMVVPAMLDSSATEEDLVFALATVVTQEGRHAKSEQLSTRRDREAVLRLMNAVTDARFQPASLRGVWLLTHTTVRARIHS